ncbi:MAG: ROK family protein [Actinophytocola sp.]|nr:ROK family protein [Actinophytocola sp.]
MRNDSGGSLANLRQSNRRAIVDALAAYGALSRADVSRRTGISRTTVSSLVAELVREGSVLEDRQRPRQPGTGRPPILLHLAVSSDPVIAVDMGHRHIRLAVAERDANVLAERTVGLNVDYSPHRALDTAAELVHELLAETGIALADIAGVGVGVPGPVDWRTGTTSSAVLPGWRGLAPAAELERRIGVAVQVDNDAFLGALGEHRYGAARGFDDVIYVKVADGLGAGLVLGGRLHRGSTGIAGEIGHVQVNENGPVCRCGSRGCLESQASVPKLIELLQPAHGETLGAETVLALADDGDAGVNRVLNDAGRAIGRVLADLCNTLNPSAVVVGGIMGSAPALVDGVRHAVDRYAQPDAAAAVRVTQSALGERAELTGAIALATSTARTISP